MLETINDYYEDIYKEQSTARIIDIHDNRIYLDRTIFYAESGGQESDLGFISLGETTLPVHNVQYEKSEKLWRTAHYIQSEIPLNNILKINDEVNLKIDLKRRIKLSAYHSASHLLYIAAEYVRSGIQQNVIGCHIKEDSARFDFLCDEKFNEQELENIEQQINNMVAQKLPIKTYCKQQGSDERVWECDGIKIPCGGTHIGNTACLTPLKVKRKGIGKGKERLICSTQNILSEPSHA